MKLFFIFPLLTVIVSTGLITTSCNFTNLKTSTGSSMPGSATHLTKGVFSYSKDAYGRVREKEPYALFFTSDSCDGCKAMTRDLEAKKANIEGTVLIVDMNKHTDIKKTYAVSQPGTIVFVHSDGTMRSRLVGGAIDDIVRFFQLEIMKDSK